jgi:hypothetical protein
MVPPLHLPCVHVSVRFVLYAAHSALVSSARIDVWDLLFSAHGIIFVSTFKGDTTKGGTNVSCVRRPV